MAEGVRTFPQSTFPQSTFPQSTVPQSIVAPGPAGVYSLMTRPRMVIAGASGLIGRHLAAAAQGRYDVIALSRAPSEEDRPLGFPVAWNPKAHKEGDEAALDALAGVLSSTAVVVNLAGASIAGGRLGRAHRRRVLESRVDATDTLVAALRRSDAPPPVWLQASAVGYYGDRGEEDLPEDAGPQPGFFLSDVCQAWEAAATSVQDETQLLILRFGLVFAKDAAAWQKLLLPIKLFVGGPLGNGRQWYAWIHAEDLARAMLELAEDEAARGVYNLVSPDPVRQGELAQQAAARLGRPALLPVPAPALRLALGGVADTLLLPSTKAVPKRLQDKGFRYRYGTLETALQTLLDAPEPGADALD